MLIYRLALWYVRTALLFQKVHAPDEEKGSLAGERLPFDALSESAWLEDHKR